MPENDWSEVKETGERFRESVSAVRSAYQKMLAVCKIIAALPIEENETQQLEKIKENINAQQSFLESQLRPFDTKNKPLPKHVSTRREDMRKFLSGYEQNIDHPQKAIGVLLEGRVIKAIGAEDQERVAEARKLVAEINELVALFPGTTIDPASSSIPSAPELPPAPGFSRRR